MPSIRVGVAPADRTQIANTAAGFTTVSFSPLVVRTGAIPTVGSASGQATGSLIGLRAGDLITNLHTWVTTAGAALTFAKLGLYDAAGNFLAATASASATFNSGTGLRSLPLTAPYTVTSNGGYYVVFLQYGAGATGATIAIAAGTTMGAPAGGVAFPVVQSAFSTDLNAGLSFGTGNSAFWFGVN